MSRLGVVLRNRDLRLLLSGSTVSLLGDGVASVAMAVAAVRTEHPATTLAVVSVAGLVPRVALGLVGGVLADRVSRRSILLAADLVRTAVAVGLGLSLLDGRAPLWVLVVATVPLGAASGAAAPAFAAIVPDVVDAADLVRANSMLSSASPFAQMMAGPALGGLLASVNVGSALLVDAATFAVSAWCVLLLRPRRQHRQGPRTLPWSDFRAGLAFVRSQPWLTINLLCGLLVTFAVSGSFTMLPLLVTRAYGVASSSFGYLIALGGAAAAVTAVVVGMMRTPARPLTASYVWYIGGLAAVAGLGLAPSVWVALPFVVVLFVGTTAGNIWQDSVLGSRIPRELRGRVSSLDWVAATAGAPLSVLLAAVAVSQVGLRETFVVAGGLAALGSLGGLLLLLRSGEPTMDAHSTRAADAMQGVHAP